MTKQLTRVELWLTALASVGASLFIVAFFLEPVPVPGVANYYASDLVWHSDTTYTYDGTETAYFPNDTVMLYRRHVAIGTIHRYATLPDSVSWEFTFKQFDSFDDCKLWLDAANRGFIKGGE